MDFSPSPSAAELISLVSGFVTDEIKAVAEEYHRQVSVSAASGTWAESPILGELRAYASRFGTHGGAGLSSCDHAPLAEQMGRATFLAPYVFNSQAPDTGNMEVLLKYGTDRPKTEWLEQS